MKQVVKRLSIPTIGFHWIVAVFMIVTTGIGLYLEEMARGPAKSEMIGLHKSFGVLALLFIFGRIIWRWKEGALPTIGNMPRWQKTAAKTMHHSLLLLTVLMPVSGIMGSLGGGRSIAVFGYELVAAGDKIEWLQEVGKTIHHLGVDALILLLVIHVLAAIKHEIIDKDGTIKRMVGKSQ